MTLEERMRGTSWFAGVIIVAAGWMMGPVEPAQAQGDDWRPDLCAAAALAGSEGTFVGHVLAPPSTARSTQPGPERGLLMTSYRLTTETGATQSFIVPGGIEGASRQSAGWDFLLDALAVGTEVLVIQTDAQRRMLQPTATAVYIGVTARDGTRYLVPAKDARQARAILDPSSIPVAERRDFITDRATPSMLGKTIPATYGGKVLTWLSDPGIPAVRGFRGMKRDAVLEQARACAGRGG